MNILDLLVKLLAGQASSVNPAEFATQILAQIKSILKSLIILMIGSIIFCLITGYLIDRVLTQMDLGSFTLTSSIIFLMTILVLDLGVIIWSLKQISATEAKKEVERTPQKEESAIEMAVAALILSFVKEREEKMKNPPTDSHL